MCSSGSGIPCATCRRPSRPQSCRPASRRRACSARDAWSSMDRRMPTSPEPAARLVSHPAWREWPLIVLSDEPLRATASEMNFLWTTFTRFEPAADIHAAEQRVVRHHVSYTPPILIDARMKPWFPKEVECDPDTAAPGVTAMAGVLPASAHRDGRQQPRPSGSARQQVAAGCRLQPTCWCPSNRARASAACRAGSRGRGGCCGSPCRTRSDSRSRRTRATSAIVRLASGQLPWTLSRSLAPSCRKTRIGFFGVLRISAW